MNQRRTVAVILVIALVGGGLLYIITHSGNCQGRLTITEFEGKTDSEQTVQFSELNQTMQRDFEQGLKNDGTVVVGDRIDHWDGIETVVYSGRPYTVGQGKC